MRLHRCGALLALLALAGCARAPQSSAPPKPPITAMPGDDLERAVPLKAPAQRVVCIGPGATETIFALGAEDKLVGRDQFSDYPKAALKVPVVGDFSGPFPEKAVALRPDLIVVQGETYDKARAQLWEKKIGAPVAVLAATTVDGVERDIEKIGAWLGVAERVAEVTRDFPSHQKAPGYMSARAWSVFFEVQRSPLWAAGKGTLIDSVLRTVGLANVADIEGYKPFNIETLLAQNPEFYITAAPHPDAKRIIKELQNAPGLKNLECIRSGRVVVLDWDLLSRPGPRLPLGIRDLHSQIARLANRDLKEPGELQRKSN